MGVKTLEKICRCLFIKWEKNVIPIIIDNNEIHTLNHLGENIWDLDDSFWTNWKKAVSFESSQFVDFCIICDELFDISEELQDKHCEYDESYWNKKTIKNAIDKIDSRNSIIIKNDNGDEIISKPVVFPAAELVLTAYYIKAQDDETRCQHEKAEICSDKTSRFAEYFMKKIKEDEMRRKK